MKNGLYLSLKMICILLTVGMTSCNSSKEVVQQPEIEKIDQYAFDFMRSSQLSVVLDQAAKEGKLVFVDVYTSWCLPCKMMDEDVFTHKPTADHINKDFISYKVNAEEEYGLNIAFQYNISSYPTLLFLDPTGNVLERKSGAVYHRELLEMADRAKVKYAM